MQVSRDRKMAGTLFIWDFNYPDAENNENWKTKQSKAKQQINKQQHKQKM